MKRTILFRNKISGSMRAADGRGVNREGRTMRQGRRPRPRGGGGKSMSVCVVMVSEMVAAMLVAVVAVVKVMVPPGYLADGKANEFLK